jgi:hypothetical protein
MNKIKTLFGLTLLLACTLNLSATPIGGSLSIPTTGTILFIGSYNDDPNDDEDDDALGNRDLPIADALPYLLVVSLGYGLYLGRRKKNSLQ